MLKLTVLEHYHVDRVTVSANTSTPCLPGIENKPDVIFRERCLDSLLDDVEECYKRQESLQCAEKEARQRCEEETKFLKQKADWLDNTLEEEIGRLSTHLREALSATQKNAAAKKQKIQCEVSAVIAQADLEIAKTRMALPGRPWSEELMAARYHALNGDAMKDARSRYLDAYEGAIREHEASLMAEDMELVALYLSWRTKRVTSTRSCKLDLDEKWTRRINLCRLRAAPVRAAYEASKRSCRDDLHNGYATAARELSSRRKARFKKGDELDTNVQTLVDAIVHQRDMELAKLKIKITKIEEEHGRQAKKLRDDYKSQLSSLKESVRLLVQPLLSVINKRRKVFAQEQEVISKDLRAVQVTLTLMESAIQTLDQDPNSLPNTHTPRRPSTRYGSELCPCGCGRRGGPTHWGQGSSEFFRRLHAFLNCKEQRRADESRRQREVEEDARRQDEERFRREEAEAQARAERETRKRFEREQEKRRQEEETRKREEARRKWEDEERRRAEAERCAREEEERRAKEEEERRQGEEERRAREEEERRKREEEEARKRAEEEKRRRDDARRREEEESRQREEERSNQQNRQDQQHSNDSGGEDAQSATGDDDIDDDDNRAGGTSNPSTAKGRTKFVRKCWNKYTEAWARLMASDVSRLPFQEIPWPILPPRKRRFTKMSITDILSRINKESIRAFILDPEHLKSISPKARIRKELLRFHPDKRIQWLKNVKDEEKEQVDETCKQVVLHLTDLLNMAA